MSPAKRRMLPSIFVDFVGKDVKVRYRDNDHVRTIHGRLLSAEEDHITIDGESGILAIGVKDVVKIEMRN